MFYVCIAQLILDLRHLCRGEPVLMNNEHQVSSPGIPFKLLEWFLNGQLCVDRDKSRTQAPTVKLIRASDESIGLDDECKITCGMQSCALSLASWR